MVSAEPLTHRSSTLRVQGAEECGLWVEMVGAERHAAARCVSRSPAKRGCRPSTHLAPENGVSLSSTKAAQGAIAAYMLEMETDRLRTASARLLQGAGRLGVWAGRRCAVQERPGAQAARLLTQHCRKPGGRAPSPVNAAVGGAAPAVLEAAAAVHHAQDGAVLRGAGCTGLCRAAEQASEADKRGAVGIGRAMRARTMVATSLSRFSVAFLGAAEAARQEARSRAARSWPPRSAAMAVGDAQVWVQAVRGALKVGRAA